MHSNQPKCKFIAAVIATMFAVPAIAAKQNIAFNNGTAAFAPTAKEKATSLRDIAISKPMPLPMAYESAVMPDEDGEIVSESLGSPGFSQGSTGNGRLMAIQVPLEDQEAIEALLEDEASLVDNSGFSSQEYGTANHPYTTMRVDLSSNTVSKLYPYRAAGKLYFKDGTSSYVCSASLIKRGVVVTAAHCVAKFGAKKFYTNFQFIPAKFGTLAPYGTWSAETAIVKTSYFDGTDSCYERGVVCQNDVAVIRLAAQSGSYPGTSTGWYGYGYNDYGFTSTSPKLTLVNQLGYPVSHDSGLMMQRTDSQGFKSTTYSNNTVWGSRQTGGSSGGPELINLGLPPSLSGTATGTAPNPNSVIGVTSWGFTSTTVKQQGASPFTSNNIVPLVNSACGTTTIHAACK